MKNSYFHILDGNFEGENGQLRDLAILDKPLTVLAAGRMYQDEEVSETQYTNRRYGRKDYQLFYIKHGEVEFMFGEKKVTLGKNTLVLFRPGEPQVYRPLYQENQLTDYSYIHFSGNMAEQKLHDYRLNFKIVTFEKPFFEFENILNQIISSEKKEFKAPFCALLLEELFIHLYNETVPEKKNEILTSSNFKNLLALMEINYNKNLPMKFYADYIGFTEKYFLRFFKKAMRISPHKYINKIRMEKARSLLLNRNRSIKAIAAELGYQNQYYFSAAFKQYYDITPSEYRSSTPKQK